MEFDIWCKHVDHSMKARFLLGVADLDIEHNVLNQWHAGGRSPEEFVAWFADRYDLIELTSWDLGHGAGW